MWERKEDVEKWRGGGNRGKGAEMRKVEGVEEI